MHRLLANIGSEFEQASRPLLRKDLPVLGLMPSKTNGYAESHTKACHSNRLRKYPGVSGFYKPLIVLRHQFSAFVLVMPAHQIVRSLNKIYQ